MIENKNNDDLKINSVGVFAWCFCFQSDKLLY